jgi:uncharacterized protein YdeI (BOF family)
MKALKLILISSLFVISFVFISCNENSKDSDSATTIPSGRYSNPDSKSSKNTVRDSSSVTDDTITAMPSRIDEKKNNPDITK